MPTALRHLWLAAGLLFISSGASLQTPGDAAPLQLETADIWKDPARLERGQKMLTEILNAAGGLEKWQVVAGLQFQVLKTRWVLVERDPELYKVHHYIPRFCWLTPGGDGFVRSEFVDGAGFGPSYRRATAVAGFAWSESAGAYNRKPPAALAARRKVRRQHFLASMPFSLHERGGTLTFMKDLGKGRSLYGLRLGQPLVMERTEQIRDFTLVVDEATKRIAQLQYSLVAEDVITMDKTTECFVDFEGALEVAGLSLPKSYTWFYEVGARYETFTIEAMRELALPPEALLRPWLSGSVWLTDLRADFWDPPKADSAKETAK